ncbi:unnamed protein product [Dibothriocephalus latus]|uniref:Ankyrin repeat domain-containing protein n=1 Tax=Dibothriocephalus latus TaxID=60516 RepID=A0A3P7PGJ6_DIBLA|nr:unnamed protein product [Dibothriocephalus latus]
MVEMNDTSVPSETLCLHRHVYMDEPELLKRLLQTMRFGTCNTQDTYDCIDHLLANGARVDIRNGWGWTPIDEAICRKNSPVAFKLWHLMRTADQERAERLFFEDFLTKVPDADIDLEWELHSWGTCTFTELAYSTLLRIPSIPLPVVHALVRNNTALKSFFQQQYRLHALHGFILFHSISYYCYRVDMSLKGFQDFSWLRGDISFLLDGSRLFDEKVVMLDHDQKLYECVTSQLSEVDSTQFDLEWSLIANSPVVALRFLHDNLSCVPNYSGWFNSEQQKVDQVSLPSLSCCLFLLTNNSTRFLM